MKSVRAVTLTKKQDILFKIKFQFISEALLYKLTFNIWRLIYLDYGEETNFNSFGTVHFTYNKLKTRQLSNILTIGSMETHQQLLDSFTK